MMGELEICRPAGMQTEGQKERTATPIMSSRRPSYEETGRRLHEAISNTVQKADLPCFPEGGAKEDLTKTHENAC